MRLRSLRQWREDQRGTAVIEFALVAPIFLMLVFGIIGYGGYFWRANAIQQVAQDSARAGLPGLTRAEREALALSAAYASISANGLPLSRTTPTVVPGTDPNTLSVQVTYDGTRDGFLNLSIVPLPTKIIQRIAAVRLGGL